jgi:hypothetical protein
VFYAQLTRLQGHRYACAFESCRTEVPGSSTPAVQYFSTWSELQRHIRDDHPPSCPHPDCDGQTFASQKALRAHMRTHEQDESPVSCGEESMPTKKARRGGDFGRDWVCSTEGCDMAFKSVRPVFSCSISMAVLTRRCAAEKGAVEPCQHHSQWPSHLQVPCIRL